MPAARMRPCAKPGGFTDRELSTATTVGALIGFAVERTRAAGDAETGRGRLLFALDAASMGTWEWDIASNRVRWSDNLERIHGLPPGTFTGEFASYEREIFPEDRGKVLASLHRALADGTPHDVEYRIVAPDGGVRWVMGKGRVEYDATGRPAHMAGVCMDISGRKRVDGENARLYEEARAALAEEAAIRERITLLTDGSASLLTSLTAESIVGEVLAFARKVIEADGYAVWRRHGDVWRTAGSAGLGQAFAAQVLPAVPALPFDRPIVARDVLAAPMLDVRRAAYEAEGVRSLMSIPLAVRGETGGSIVFYYRTTHDPTEVELRVAVALGHLAAAAINNAELYAAQQRLRQEAEAAERRAAFLAAASEALSSLDYEANLRRVARLAVPGLCDWCLVDLLDDGMVRRVAMTHADPAQEAQAEEVYRRYPADPDQPRGVARVLRTGEAELHESIADEMLVESARSPEHLAILRAAAVESLMIVPLVTSGRITVGVSIDPNLPALTGDSVRLQQVFWNLVTNAVKFTGPGGRVSVCLAADARDVVLTVSDTGEGIDPQFLPHIFEMFRQAERAGSRRHGGFGLGLSIVRRLVEPHGGSVNARSDGAGTGATFTVRLPHRGVVPLSSGARPTVESAPAADL